MAIHNLIIIGIAKPFMFFSGEKSIGAIQIKSNKIALYYTITANKNVGRLLKQSSIAAISFRL